MLAAFPLGLLTTSVVFDMLWAFTKSSRWADIAFSLLASGIVAGLIAAPFGSMDWMQIPRGTRARRIGLLHGGAAITSVTLFAVSWWLRYEIPTAPPWSAVIVSLCGGLVLGVAGWLGGELVERLGVGVDAGANFDAPSSLSGKRADQPAENRTTGSNNEQAIVNAARSVT